MPTQQTFIDNDAIYLDNGIFQEGIGDKTYCQVKIPTPLIPNTKYKKTVHFHGIKLLFEIENVKSTNSAKFIGEWEILFF